MLIGIITTALVNFVVSISRGYNYLQVQSNTSVDLSNTLNRVAKVVRGTTDVVDAEQNSLTIYAYFSPNDAVVDKVKYYVSGSQLLVSVIPPTGTAPNYTYSASDEKITVLTNSVANGGNSSFTYYDDLGGKLTGSFSLNQIKQIGIYIGTNPNTKVLRQPLNSQTIVTLRNKKTNL